MEAIKLCRLDTPIIFIEARINLSRFVVTGCAAKTSATVTFPSLNLRSEERFSRNAETDLVCRLLLEKKNDRSSALRCVEACVYGTLDFVGYPRFPAPVEFISSFFY